MGPKETRTFSSHGFVCESEDVFYEKINQDKICIVDFHAQWCGPCKMIAPKFQEFATKYTNVIALKVDVDDLDDTAQKMEISAMPTFLVLKGGKEVDRLMGA